MVVMVNALIYGMRLTAVANVEVGSPYLWSLMS